MESAVPKWLRHGAKNSAWRANILARVLMGIHVKCEGNMTKYCCGGGRGLNFGSNEPPILKQIIYLFLRNPSLGNFSMLNLLISLLDKVDKGLRFPLPIVTLKHSTLTLTPCKVEPRGPS